MTGRRARAAASIGWAAAALMTVLAIAVWLNTRLGLSGLVAVGPVGFAAILVPPAVFASMGALLAIRRPGNAVGWLLLVAGIGFAVSGLATLVASTGSGATAEWAGATALAGWVASAAWPVLGVSLLTIGFLFPTGRPQSVRWARVLRVQLLVWAVLYGLALIKPGPLALFDNIDNPLGVGPDLGLSVGSRSMPLVILWHLVMAIPATAATAARYRHGGVLARAQLRWLLAAVNLTTVCALVPLAAGAAQVGDVRQNTFALAVEVFAVASTTIPVAVAIAILRYRLFDIDRLISRTIAYAAISATLLALYAGSILVLQAPLSSFTNGQSLAVAVSTLLVATLFQPVRQRFQRAVDRRFHRAQYDAERTTAAFADRLRDEVDLPTLATELTATVGAAIQPSSVGLWLRERR